MSRRSDEQRYNSACHAMQSGVMYEMEQGDGGATPKHLRVGVNSALVSHAALVKLLIEKGVFTEDEYVTSQADMMQAEVALYEARANHGNSGPLHFG